MSGARPHQTVSHWPGGRIQVKVPLPYSLRWVNSYLVPDSRGYTLIDPGLHTAEAAKLWETVLAEQAVDYASIHTILLTHQHPDHYGLAGWFQERSGAPVKMSAAARAYTRELWNGSSDFAERLLALYARHGMPQEQLAGIRSHLASFVPLVSPQPHEVQFLEAGELLELGQETWEVLSAPGHAFGQLCFFQRQSGTILCGDQVLPDITPNISLVPGGEPDPLASFLASLEELAALPVVWAFPGHRDPFTGFAERIAEIRDHHERRLSAIRDRLAEPYSAYEVCRWLFGARVGSDSHNLRFAMAETLAHLQHLALAGQAVQIDAPGEPGGLLYRASS